MFKFNLINIILGKMIIPELIQSDCNPKNINLELEKIIKNNAKTIPGPIPARNILSTDSSTTNA